MGNISVVYFSGYGHTKRQAEAVIEGAASVPGTSVHIVEISAEGTYPEETFDTINNSGAVIFGSPTYMGGPAWQFKKFADESSGRWLAQCWKDKLAAGFTNSSSVNGDKGDTINYLFTLAMQHGQIWVGTGLLPSNAKANTPDDVNWTGGFKGALAISPSDSTPDEAPVKGDLETAVLLGQRVATLLGELRLSSE